ncbi:hypothetical protein GCK72_021675 [Caenorhabditis remanei]|uniref:Uncharacterized protein n=1 Tax=Caenorhabditis remanei TaxID=31234 RepID=A0A6A5GKH8_CAERE|nr:hypothetical protein GCK72_021675 [Caenorhabditis remanei]KAF1755106.1 hypothetical protein GCK72_021675 [Caenorhabditis remanei]
MTTLRDKLYAERQLNKHAFGNRPSVSRIEDEPTSNEDPTTEMEPINKQNYFALLNQVGDSQFRKVILVGLLNIVIIGVFVAILFSLFFLNHKDPHTPPDNLSTTVSSATTVSAHSTNTTLLIPTTSAPTTSSPTTSSPTTSAPTTSSPTTSAPTTSSPTTSAPTTSSPTTSSPTTSAPTTSSPTTSSPTTSSPTTSSPTTSAPTTRTDTTVHSHSSVTTTKPYGRFDMVNNLNQRIMAFVSSNSFGGLPDPSESIKDPSEGSAVLDIIDFFFKQDVAYCGATLFIVTKRLPTDTYTSNQVTLLKTYHAYVTFVVSENSFGGLSSEPMYRLASETNGLCIFTEDRMITDVWSNRLVSKYTVLCIRHPLGYHPSGLYIWCTRSMLKCHM